MLHHFDREMRPDGILPWIICAAAVPIFAADAVLNPDRMYISLLVALFGLIIGWRTFTMWKHRRTRSGLDLLQTVDTSK